MHHHQRISRIQIDWFVARSSRQDRRHHASAKKTPASPAVVHSRSRSHPERSVYGNFKENPSNVDIATTVTQHSLALNLRSTAPLRLSHLSLPHHILLFFLGTMDSHHLC